MILLQSFGSETGIGTSTILIFLAISLLAIIAEWKMFEKAGKPGWAILIPIYNTIVLLEIVGKPWWWIFLFLIPGINLIIAIIVMNALSKSFGKGAGFTLGLIFLSIIFILILGFGSDEYIGPGGAKQE